MWIGKFNTDGEPISEEDARTAERLIAEHRSLGDVVFDLRDEKDGKRWEAWVKEITQIVNRRAES